MHKASPLFLVFLAALLFAGVALPSAASAQPRGNIGANGIHGVRIEVHGTLGYYQALGAGMRVDIPPAAGRGRSTGAAR